MRSRTAHFEKPELASKPEPASVEPGNPVRVEPIDEPEPTSQEPTSVEPEPASKPAPVERDLSEVEKRLQDALRAYAVERASAETPTRAILHARVFVAWQCATTNARQRSVENRTPEAKNIRATLDRRDVGGFRQSIFAGGPTGGTCIYSRAEVCSGAS